MKNAYGIFFMLLPAIFCTAAPPASKGSNLLRNGGFTSGDGSRVEGWVFPPTPLKNLGVDAAQIERGVETEKSGNSFLVIATKAPIKAHLWWQQEIEAQGSASYIFSVRVAADIMPSAMGTTRAVADIGIYYLDARGKWLGFEALPSPREFASDWKTVTMKVTAPDNAAKIGVRLGVNTTVEMKVRFDDAVLSLAP